MSVVGISYDLTSAVLKYFLTDVSRQHTFHNINAKNTQLSNPPLKNLPTHSVWCMVCVWACKDLHPGTILRF